MLKAMRMKTFVDSMKANTERTLLQHNTRFGVISGITIEKFV